MKKLLLFGASGVIGSALRKEFLEDGWTVVAAGRKISSLDQDPHWITVDPFTSSFDASVFDHHGPYSAVCWAQGDNANDSLYDFQEDRHMALYQANCLFIIKTLHILLERSLLQRASKLCIISSIWQNRARQNKLSYCVTKSALQGLVLSAAVDLAKDGHVINAVLPGALETPMTRAHLSPEQVDAVSKATSFGRLTAMQDVVHAVKFLCAPSNTSITGQFITADLGFSNVRLL